jgi:hypothetical protein
VEEEAGEMQKTLDDRRYLEKKIRAMDELVVDHDGFALKLGQIDFSYFDMITFLVMS